MIHNREKSIARRDFLRSSGGMIGASVIAGKAAAEENTRYRTLGRTGLKVSAVGFGTVHTDRPNVLKRVVDSGVNFIDTGRMYANGKNEEMIGKVIEDVRKDIVLQTKFTSKLLNDADAISKSIEESLRALRTDCIDLMLIHSLSSVSQLKSQAAIDALSKAKEQGKIRFTGFSSHDSDSWKILDAAEEGGFYDVALVAYNHAGYFDHTVYRGFHVDWNQDELEKSIARAVSKGMGIAAMKTCSAGPYSEAPGEKASFAAGLKWILRNKNISTMATCMSSFREVEEDVAVMEV